jgi:hypothetical protein
LNEVAVLDVVGEDLYGCREFVCGFLVAVEPLEGLPSLNLMLPTRGGYGVVRWMADGPSISPVAFSGLRVAAKRRERFPTVELELGADVRRVEQGEPVA